MFELEFFPVGEGAAAGDAIVLRYVFEGYYRVIVIDGGTEDSGKSVVSHIKNEFGEDQVVDHVISTHPDTDHSSGLRSILRELPVKNLWLHGVWHHCDDIRHFFADRRWTAAGLERAIRDKYPIISELLDIAAEKEIPVYEPFQGVEIGPFTVLSPSEEAYLRLVPQFRKTPDSNKQLIEQAGYWIEPRAFTLTGFLEAAKSILTPETWHNETLREGGRTAAENESSTVLLGQFGDSRVLLTGDAGLKALTWAADFADQNGIKRFPLNLIQVPHHGSRNNVSPSVLDRWVGGKVPDGTSSGTRAIASVPKDDAVHPRKIVANAFLRRGVGVRTTGGAKYRYYAGDMPIREGEGIAQPLPFFDAVEKYD